MTEQCKDCKYYFNKSNYKGECRRNAPIGSIKIVIAPGVNLIMSEDLDDDAFDYIFPLIEWDSWCGEFSL